MIPYGETKRTHKIHPHNECGVCSEKSFGKKTARQESAKIVAEFVEDLLKNQIDCPKWALEAVDEHFWELT
jgi:hypothetical protein